MGVILHLVAPSDRSDDATDLKPPAVAAHAYDEDYYRHHCGPHETWDAHEGREIDPYYHGMVRRIELRPGERLVDLGAGRGELLAVAIQAGAGSAIGIEYSEAAVRLARQTLDAQGVADRAEIRLGDIRATQLPDARADVVTLLDVVEHLTPKEVQQALAEAGRLLRPGGRVVIHTLPNRLVYDITYRLQRLARPQRIRRWPRDPRNELEHEMHVNEQTLRTLKRSVMTAGFADVTVERGQWILDEFVPEEDAKQLYHRLARYRLTAPFARADLWGRGVKK